MTKKFTNTRFLLTCLALSLLVHIIFLYVPRLFGTCILTRPVQPPSAVMMDLTRSLESVYPPKTHKIKVEPASTSGKEEADSERFSRPAQDGEQESKHSETDTELPTPESPIEEAHTPIHTAEIEETTPIKTIHKSHATARLNANDFLSMQHERLIYQISMLGLPVGSAELVSRYVDGEVRFTLRVKSNTAFSSLYPVDNVVETRHIARRFIMTKIMQHEGSFRSDEGFTINLGKKRVSWYDNISGRSRTTTIPSEQVLDTLSGIYYLRNRQLQVGQTETIPIFDSEAYAEVPVEILRREVVRLPNITEVDTLVIKPLQKSAGIFRRTGDLLIWLTDDAYKVPVKIVTSIPLGTITIELISAESDPMQEEAPLDK